MNNRRIAVVFVAYGCVPEQRVRDHFAWNRDFYARENVALVAVCGEDDFALPWGTVCRLPERMLPELNGRRVFSLTIAKNEGIRTAIGHGAEVVICTDVDIAFSQFAFDTMCEVEQGQAIFPVYHQAAKYATRNAERPRRVDYGMSGTTAMTAADWGRVQYDERCIAYGADDGILLRDIQRAGIELIPPYREHPAAPIVWHIDHTKVDGGVNVPGAGRSDCWGRAEGFNPDNFKANQKFHSQKKRP